MIDLFQAIDLYLGRLESNHLVAQAFTMRSGLGDVAAVG